MDTCDHGLSRPFRCPRMGGGGVFEGFDTAKQITLVQCLIHIQMQLNTLGGYSSVPLGKNLKD
jgi:hypothetical protein